MASWITSSNFVPFNEFQEPLPKNEATGSIDTKLYLSGKDIKSLKDFYRTTSIKIWGGSINRDGTLDHHQLITTYGQPEDSITFFNDNKFIEQDKFNSFQTLYTASIKYPILLNGGPQNSFEGIKIFKDPFYGNNITPDVKPNELIKFQTNFQRYTQYTPFLEQQNSFGLTNSGSVIIPNLISDVTESIKPFSELRIHQNTNLKLENLDNIITLEESDPLEKSSGTGLNIGYNTSYNRDSITYIGYFRGSK